VSEPYSQRARSVCVSLSAFFQQMWIDICTSSNEKFLRGDRGVDLGVEGVLTP